MRKFPIGSIVKANPDSYSYFNFQFNDFKENDLLIIELDDHKDCYSVRNLRTKESCSCFYRRVIENYIPYDPNQESEDDCL